eukprot:10582621-Ditylum_brightwellii.AAC.1
MSGKHKTIQNGRSICKVSIPSCKKKLSKTVEDLAGLKEGFYKGMVELVDENSLQKPAVVATVSSLADGGIMEEIEQTTVITRVN